MSRITSTKPKTKAPCKTSSPPHPTSTRLPKNPQRLHLSQPRKPTRLYLRPPKKPQRLILRPPQKPILLDRSPNRQPPIRGTMKIKKEEDTVENPLERISEAATDVIDTSTHTSVAENVCAMEIKKEREEEEKADGETDTWTTAEGSRRVRDGVWQGEVGGIVFGDVRW